jgi:hypothetical protein
MKKLLHIFLLATAILACNLPAAGTPTPGPAENTDAITDTPPPTLTATPASAPIGQPYDLLIVAPARFIPPLSTLAAWKNSSGLRTGLLTLEDAYQACPGRDQAEQVKRCLALYQQKSGIRFAFLVGNAANFPVRYTMADINTPAVFNTAYYATDLYYADLYHADGSFDDWDSNSNGLYGEIGGEMRPGLLNIDRVDLNPDIAVGRLPAYSADEVQTYVTKVIAYESGAYNAAWSRRMILISSPSFDSGYCSYQQDVAGLFPTGRDLIRLYPPGNPCADTPPPDMATILAEMDKGAGFVSYIGHGDMDLWADTVTIKDITNLKNQDGLPIIFAGGCGTGTFTIGAPGGPYLDIHGTVHAGAQAGETFSAMPPQPAVLQPENNAEGMMKYMLVQSPNGAVIYIGAITGAQFPALFDLNTAFFRAISLGEPNVGNAWNSAIREYYTLNRFEESYTNADWYVLARFHQPWKFLLFGDPSLRIGGVPAK